MTETVGIEPPAGYTLFAAHAANGWDFWVPPPGADITTRLQRYQFINQGAGKVGKYGPPPCVSAGAAAPDSEKPWSVYTWDVANDFSPYGNDPTEPYIPQFIAMWCSYVTAIAPDYGWTQIEIGNVVNDKLSELLYSLGFEEEGLSGNYVGVMTTINPKVRARCAKVGWQFAATAPQLGERKVGAETASQLGE